MLTPKGRRAASRRSERARISRSCASGRPGGCARRGRAPKPSRGTTSTGRCSSGCARCVSRSPGAAASRRTSSSTIRRCARWRGSSRRRVGGLLTVKGVGARKAEDLGDLFLAAIRESALTDTRLEREPSAGLTSRLKIRGGSLSCLPGGPHAATRETERIDQDCDDVRGTRIGDRADAGAEPDELFHHERRARATARISAA